jgi:beta-lactamase regulating signal transducer with metallopeptidase domain
METPDVSPFLFLLGRTSAQAAVLVLLVLAVQWLFRRQLTPRWRCALWLLVAARLLLPISFSSETSVFNLLPREAQMSPLFPPQSLASGGDKAIRPAQPASSDNRAREISSKTGAGLGTASATAPMPTAMARTEFVWSWPVCIFTIWLAGVVLLAGHVAVSFFRLRRRCGPLPAAHRTAAMDVLQECCGRLGLWRAPVLLESCAVGSPALHGLIRPRLLLPLGFTAKFSTAELRFVFLHELAHLKRRDLLVNWIVVLLQVAHWFNPLVWFGFARWRAERELACDAMALEAAGEGQNKEYGRTILRLLDHFSRPMAAPGLVGILEDKRQLHRRIGMIASYVPTRGWPRLALVLTIALAVIGLTNARSTTSPASAPAGLPVVAISPAPQASMTPVISENTAPQPKGIDMNKTSITNQLMAVATAGLLSVTAPAAPALPTAGTAAGIPANQTPTASTAPVEVSAGAGQALAQITPVAAAASAPAPDAPVATPSDSELANELKGAWILVGRPGQVGKAPSSGGRIKFFTGDHWCITQAEPKSGVVLFNHGGTYTVEGNTYHESVDYANASTITHVGNKNDFKITIEGDTLTSTGIGNPWNEVWKRLKPTDAKALPEDLTGTWAYAGKPGQTNAPPLDTNRLKFCAGGYWCDITIDPKTSVVTYHHGGSCVLKGDKYVETCQYANPTTMELIGEDVKFGMQLNDGTVTLTGLNNPWKEIWKRLE